MPQITSHLSIDAPAERVWQIIGPGFARIGDWATSVPASVPLPATAPAAIAPAATTPAAAAASAPVTGRTCHTGVGRMPTVNETLTSYDDSSRTLSYEATGMPGFITTASSTWVVTPTGEDSSRVTVTGIFRTRGPLGLLACWAIILQARLTARHLQADLRHYVKFGTASPRKQRRQSRGRRP
jgi:hypothetical protein